MIDNGLGEGFDYAAIVSNVATRLCDDAKPGQILISRQVLTKVENAVNVEPVSEFELKGIRRPLAAYNVLPPCRQKCKSIKTIADITRSEACSCPLPMASAAEFQSNRSMS